jgi:hypothetical protein
MILLMNIRFSFCGDGFSCLRGFASTKLRWKVETDCYSRMAESLRFGKLCRARRKSEGETRWLKESPESVQDSFALEHQL